MLGDHDRKGRPQTPPEELLAIVPPRRRARQHHRRVHSLNLRVGVMDGMAVAVPGGLDNVDEAHEPIDGFVEPPRAKGGAVAALVHRRKQAGKQNAVHEHHRDHEKRAGGQVDAGSAHADSAKMAAEIAESDPVVATGQLLAILLVQELERIKHHFLALHRRIPCKRLVNRAAFRIRISGILV